MILVAQTAVVVLSICGVLAQDNYPINVSDCDYIYNVFSTYSVCIPSFHSNRVSKFDVCGKSSRIEGSSVDSGFIHSPNYPFYYGNSRNCLLTLSVPEDRRLIMYAVRVSMEDSSVFHGGANDFVRVTSGNGRLDFLYFGLHPLPKFIYEGTDQRNVRVNFRSDWITTQPLKAPKGFLIYFELIPIVTKSTTSTSTTSTTTSTSSTTESTTESTSESTTTLAPTTPLNENLIDNDDSNSIAINSDEISDLETQNINLISARIENEHRGDRMIGILVILVSVIGVLVLIIFGLLLLLRRQRREAEEDTIYDSNDSKSMGSNTIYADDYVSSPRSTIKMDACKPNMKTSQSNSSPFNERLKRLYYNLNKTISMSSQILGSNVNKEVECGDKKTESDDKKPKFMDRTMNEYSASVGECEVKVEKDMVVDKLRLFRPTTPLKSSYMDRELIKSGENTYVASTPVQVSDMTTINEDGRLNIYEVDFDNDVAYIVPTVAPSTKSISKEDAEIYQAINESEIEAKSDYDDAQGLIPASTNDEMIYSTPSNKLIDRPSDDDDRSVLRLVQHDKNETHA